MKKRGIDNSGDEDCQPLPATAASNLIPRYSRQMIVPSIGLDGQVILSSSSVLVVGAGGIGSTVLLYLAGAGVGHIGVLDFDTVEISNLHRQVVHETKNEGMKKCDSAVARMKALNNSVKYTAIDRKLSAGNAIECFERFDLIVDATDNFEARYLINDACVLLAKPLVSGSAVGLEGQVTVFAPRVGPCYRCLYPNISLLEGCRSCANAGVLGPVPGLVGCLQAVEVIKVLLSRAVMEDVSREGCKNNLETVSETATAEKSQVNGENNSKKARLNPDTKSQEIPGREGVQQCEVKPKRKNVFTPLVGRQILYDASAGEFHNFSLPPKNPSCKVCGVEPSIRCMEDSENNLKENSKRISEAAPNMTLPEGASISVTEYGETCRTIEHILLDVRNNSQFEMISFLHYSDLYRTNLKEVEQAVEGKIPGIEIESNQNVPGTDIPLPYYVSNNVHLLHFPLSELKGILEVDLKKEIVSRMRNREKFRDFERNSRDKVNGSGSSDSSGDRLLGSDDVVGRQTDSESESIGEVDSEIGMHVFCVCRRGVDSILATQILARAGIKSVHNITGGLTAWSSTVDPSFPMY